ncbi:MAG: Rpn family recombination-promoting nuclease/putative transposase [Saprospiraceae bacterium]|nr:Rpn family recombination-promoting nuclease/putative transposase [Saprospiraceae bacterium]
MVNKHSSKASNSSKKSITKTAKKEGNIYDKIFKENVEKIFRPLIEKQLGAKIAKATPLKEKMQTTVELEMDFFYEILTDTGEQFILHLEFESGINYNMVYRVGEYHSMALRRYKLDIRHIVVYLGEEPPPMRTQLKPEEIYTGFDLLNVQGLDTNQLLSSQVPEVVLIAVLSNYPKEEAERVLRQIILNLKQLVKHKRTLKKYLNQLMMLSRLRKIEELTIKITEEMPIHYNIETDALYLKGSEKGKLEGKLEEAAKKDYLFVSNLLTNTDFDDEKIANLANVTLAFVQQVKGESADLIQISPYLQEANFDDEKIARLTNVSLAFIKKIRLIFS